MLFACAAGRAFLLAQGGACYTASWAKFALCLLGVMDWEAHERGPAWKVTTRGFLGGRQAAAHQRGG